MWALSAVVVALVSSTDNLAVGISLGLRPARVPLWSNLVMAAITMVGTGVAMGSAHWAARYLPAWVATLVGAVIIVAIGAWTLGVGIVSFRADRRPGPGTEASKAGRPEVVAPISARETVVLGCALSLNNLATGAGAGSAGVPVVLTVVLAGAASLAAVGGGARLGTVAARHWMRRYGSMVSGLVMLAVGFAVLATA